MTSSDEVARALLAQIPDLSGEAVIVAAGDAPEGARILYANGALEALLGRPARKRSAASRTKRTAKRTAKKTARKAGAKKTAARKTGKRTAKKATKKRARKR